MLTDIRQDCQISMEPRPALARGTVVCRQADAEKHACARRFGLGNLVRVECLPQFGQRGFSERGLWQVLDHRASRNLIVR